MARYNDNECAYCAAELDAASLIGKDWKVYCSEPCVQAGEQLWRNELQQLMELISDRRSYSADTRRTPALPQ